MKTTKHAVQQPKGTYKKAERDLLTRALLSSFTERFHTMARLMKLNIILKSAKVRHQNITNN